MNKHKFNKHLVYVLTIVGLFSYSTASAGIDSDSGAELNKMRQRLELESVKQRIKDGKDTKNKVDETVYTNIQEKQPPIRFVLKSMEISPSVILKPSEIDGIVSGYIGREINVDDLYAVVERFNTLYNKKGFLTCRAFIKPQTIKDGKVHITLVEGRTKNILLESNKTTKSSYILKRLNLKENEIPNITKLNKKMLRFNASNDVQLRISLKPAETFGNTDYVITAYEPQKTAVGVFLDNAGSKTNGTLRGGVFWQDRSLTGRRDMLSLNSVFSEGSRALLASYSTPVGTDGSKLGMNYSVNNVRIVSGPLEPLGVKGNSYVWGASFTKPILTTEKSKSELGVEYSYQKSQTTFANNPWVDDTIQSVNLFYDQFKYGETSVFYQKHAYKFGNYKNITGNSSNFGKYLLNTLWQKYFSENHQLSIRFDAQLSNNKYLPSAEQFYIGGMYSVRGYAESLLSGDKGMLLSLEYGFPLLLSSKTTGYIFLDGGRVWGDSSFDSKNLLGAGFGVKSRVGRHSFLNVGMGVPLINKINNLEQSKARVHFTWNSQF